MGPIVAGLALTAPLRTLAGVSFRDLSAFAANQAGRRVAPVVAGGAGRQFLARSIDGFQGFPGAKETGTKQLVRTNDVDEAIKQVIEQHVRLAGLGGFVTQVGGVMAMVVTLPANVAGLAAIQLRMTATIAHLRGHDVDAPRVRIAALATLLGEEGVGEAILRGALPTRPRELAFGPPITDPEVQSRLTTSVGQHLLTRVTAKHATLQVMRRVPLLGGGVGAGMDAVYTWRIGRYADQEFTPALQVERG
jgi:uncharacterized protein (DUF697 family)